MELLSKLAQEKTEEDFLEALDKCLDASRSIHQALQLWRMTEASRPDFERIGKLMLLRIRAEQRKNEDGLGRVHSVATSSDQFCAADPTSTLSDCGSQGVVAAKSGRPSNAAQSQLNGEARGQGSIAQNTSLPSRAAASPPNGGGTGQLGASANSGPTKGASPSPITHNYQGPSAANIRASLGAKLHAAKTVLTVLDTYKIGATPIGDMTMLDLREAYERNIEQNTVIKQILRSTANAPANMKVRDAIKASDLDAMIKKARELADVA